MKIKAILALVILCLTGCVAAPSRDLNPSEFPMYQSGKIPVNSIQSFKDCIVDGFSNSHWVGTNIHTREQKRSSGYRIEAIGGGSTQLVSVDILNDGSVALYESNIAKLIDTSGEHNAFKKCLSDFSKN